MDEVIITPSWVLTKMAKVLQRESEEMCSSGCGQPYPDVVLAMPGMLIIAGLDAAKEYAAPTLKVYTERQAMAWSQRAYDYQQLHPDLTFGEALLETEE
jgi:hypothetical protein